MNGDKSNDVYDYMVKLLMIGDSGVGKTCLLLRFCQNECPTTHLTTIGIDFKIKTITVDDKKVKMMLWDTAGQEKFKTITQTYYKGAMGIALVYSITDRKSFLEIDKWMKQVKDNSNENVSIMLIGNKCDDQGNRKVEKSEGEELAKKYKIQFLETSALENKNVHEMFYMLAKDMKKTLENNTVNIQSLSTENNNLSTETNKKFTLTKSTTKPEENKKKGGCC